MSDIVRGPEEALAVARGQQPAARIHVNGYAYVPEVKCAALRAENERLKEWNREIALNAREFAAENERLRAYALKAFTVVEFCCGEGFVLEPPFYDCNDLLLEGVNLLNVETSEDARAALEEK